MKCPGCGSHQCAEFEAAITAPDVDAITDVIRAHTLRYQERGYDEGWNVQYNVRCITCGPVDEETSESRHQAEAVTEYLKGTAA